MYNNKKKMEDNLIELDRRAAEAQDETTETSKEWDREKNKIKFIIKMKTRAPTNTDTHTNNRYESLR